MGEKSYDIDGVSKFMGFRWESPERMRLTITRELINAGGLLSGAVTYALIDYSMGSALWIQRNEGERIATLNIAINYIATAIEGDIICTSRVDRRNRTAAVLRSEVVHEDGRVLATAIGSYSIFKRKPADDQPPAADAPVETPSNSS